MFVVAERLNSTRKSVAPAIKERDQQFVIDEARKQAEAGGDIIDCNAATVGVEQEPDALCWMVRTVQDAVDRPCSLDSPNAAAIEAALNIHRGVAMINSITAEQEKYDALVPLARDHKTKVIALPIMDQGMPETEEQRLEGLRRLVGNLLEDGIEADNIYADPLVFPVGSSQENGVRVLNTLRRVKEEFPNIHTIGGLSNVSHGMPKRFVLNRAFAVLCLGAGIDAAIIDPLDPHLMSLILATEALLGRDEFCANYIGAERAGKLVV